MNILVCVKQVPNTKHMTGVLDSGCIVAINRDPKAEVFQYADYCVVGDMFSIIPELQERMEADR